MPGVRDLPQGPEIREPEQLPPIPIPLRQRWHDARTRVLPGLVLGTTICVIGVLWRTYVAAPERACETEPSFPGLSSKATNIMTTAKDPLRASVAVQEP